ncbi:MAG: bifunctional phosphopantothenoylcysteine decarboxylase/phosphopantothenate--cysteine ligase CoaBC, partial [Acidobacteria bacterium]|nr:bifunctional phosphopantothenoylcysteine decarboxylase/phosphopantothenate--cysteine ligase CoaBC [Acidobacteriota bacterium]
IERLRRRGVHIVEPDAGYLACGMKGPGRLASNDAIVERVLEVLGIRQDLKNEVVLVTAGPTREAIDPVRYISNRSSGKMGYAVAQAARARGARTLLISGPTALQPPVGVETTFVTTVAEMRAAVLERLPQVTVLIKAAAVGDYRPQRQAAQKIRKSGPSSKELTLVLQPTEDILAAVAEQKGDRIVVGFAAETENLVANARAKLQAKRMDLIVANDVSVEGNGFDSDYNQVTLLDRDGLDRHISRLPKIQVAHEILNEVVRLRSHGRS